MGPNAGTVESDAVATGVDRPTAILAAGDLGIVVAVLLVGEIRHGFGPLSYPVRVLGSVAPFVVGWILVAALLGVYGERCWSPGWSVRTTAGAWIGAANVGLIVRNAPSMPGGLTWPFPLVVTGSILVCLVAWRGAAAWYVQSA